MVATDKLSPTLQYSDNVRLPTTALEVSGVIGFRRISAGAQEATLARENGSSTAPSDDDRRVSHF